MIIWILSLAAEVAMNHYLLERPIILARVDLCNVQFLHKLSRVVILWYMLGVSIILPLVLILMMFVHLFLPVRFHAAKIAAQERAVGKKLDKEAFMTFFIMTVCLVIQWSILHVYCCYVGYEQVT